MWSSFLNLLFPKLCFGCQEMLLNNEEVICRLCRNSLPLTHHCNMVKNEATRKFYGRIPIEYASSFLYYSKGGIVQNILHHLKYRNQPEISYFLGKMYAQKLLSCPYYKHLDAIIPVPLHKDKLRSRGYNQLNGFAQALSEELKIPIANHLLYKTKNYSSQTKKSIFDRTSKTEEKFEIEYNLEDSNKHYLLIDDILTTGGTIESCAKKILQIPNCKISIACLASTR